MKFIIDYLRLSLFSIGLLIGIQVPAFIDQYAKRVDAHFVEAEQNMAGFQQTADRYFSGDIDKLIKHYQQSDDQVFNDDAANIRFLHHRVQFLEKEMQMLSRSAVFRAYHVLFGHDKKLFDETFQHYSYALLLNPQALIWGIVFAFCLTILVEALILGCAAAIKSRRRSNA